MSEENLRSRLLVVDDDADLRALLTRYLEDQGYHAEAVPDGPAMHAWLAEHTADLIILDLMLPGEDGLSLARRLREQGQTPIVMLSARGEELDRIVGLEVGADDYLAKPFNPRELLARIRAVLRRSNATTPPSAEEFDGQIRFGGFRLDPEARILMRGDQEVMLTRGEMSLLIALATHPNRVLSRDRLLDLIDAADSDRFDRSIDVRITRLRRKLDDSGAQPRFIRTVWGEGYRFTPDGPGPEAG